MNKPKYQIVKNEKGLIRDTHSKAIINTDQKQYEEYMAQKKRINSKNDRIKHLEDKVESIENKLDKILEKI